MVYNTLSDYLLDNRRGVEEQLKHAKTVAQASEIALESYDWVAQEYIRHQAVQKIVKEEIIKAYGEEAFREIDDKVGARYKELLTAGSEYRFDIQHGRRVGYSAEEEE